MTARMDKTREALQWELPCRDLNAADLRAALAEVEEWEARVDAWERLEVELRATMKTVIDQERLETAHFVARAEAAEAERDTVLANLQDEVVQTILVRHQLAAATEQAKTFAEDADEIFGLVAESNRRCHTLRMRGVTSGVDATPEEWAVATAPLASAAKRCAALAAQPPEPRLDRSTRQ